MKNGERGAIPEHVAHQALDQYLEDLSRLPGVVGVGIGKADTENLESHVINIYVQSENDGYSVPERLLVTSKNGRTTVEVPTQIHEIGELSLEPSTTAETRLS